MTKEKFEAYEKVRQSGRTNMFDISAVIRLSKKVLTREDCLDVMKHYSEYRQQFLETVNQ